MRHTKSAGWLLSAAAIATVFSPVMGQEQQPATTATETPSAAATTSGASAAAAAEPVSPGPLLEARKMLWMRINLAKSEGIGTSTYIAAFKNLDEDVKYGKSADELRPRIESLARSLKDQLERSKILKTQRPIPPSSSQSATGSTPPDAGAIGAALGGKGGGGLETAAAALNGRGEDSVLDNLKAQLMSGGGGNLEALKQKAMQTKKGREFLEKLGL